MKELPAEIHEKITELSAIGDTLAEQGKYAEAIARYNTAWELVPEPSNEWAASTWLLAAIGDACFLSEKYKSAKDAFEYVMHCPDALGNPFLHLRLGQVLYEHGEYDRAADELMRAYMGAGAEIFENDDPKYLSFLGTKADLE